MWGHSSVQLGIMPRQPPHAKSVRLPRIDTLFMGQLELQLQVLHVSLESPKWSGLAIERLMLEAVVKLGKMRKLAHPEGDEHRIEAHHQLYHTVCIIDGR